MRKGLLIILTCLTCALHATVYTPAIVPDPKQQGQNYYVSNPDAIISDSDVMALNKICNELKQQTDVEMAIVCVDSISEPYTMFDFGFELFQTWGIGVKDKNTGILITLCQSRRSVFFNTGTGIEGVMSDAACYQIQQAYMVPLFRENDYAGGLIMGALAIYERCTQDNAKEELLNMRSVTQRGGFVRHYDDDTDSPLLPESIWAYMGILILFCFPMCLLCFLLMLPVCYQRKRQTPKSEYMQRKIIAILLVIILFVVWLFAFTKYIIYSPSLSMMIVVFKYICPYIRCPLCGKFSKQKYRTFTSIEPTEDTKGQETHIYTCPHCGHTHSFTTVLPKVSSSSGDSGSGSYSSDSGGSWGGGSSSGGGAGSSW